jgi:hypothetical protein
MESPITARQADDSCQRNLKENVWGLLSKVIRLQVLHNIPPELSPHSFNAYKGTLNGSLVT